MPMHPGSRVLRTMARPDAPAAMTCRLSGGTISPACCCMSRARVNRACSEIWYMGQGNTAKSGGGIAVAFHLRLLCCFFDISGGDLANSVLPYLDYDVIA